MTHRCRYLGADVTCREAGRKGGETRGRQMAGSGNPNAKLCPQDVENVRAAKGFATAEEVGQAVGVHYEHVRKIWRKVHW